MYESQLSTRGCGPSVCFVSPSSVFPFCEETEEDGADVNSHRQSASLAAKPSPPARLNVSERLGSARAPPSQIRLPADLWTSPRRDPSPSSGNDPVKGNCCNPERFGRSGAAVASHPGRTSAAASSRWSHRTSDLSDLVNWSNSLTLKLQRRPQRYIRSSILLEHRDCTVISGES